MMHNTIFATRCLGVDVVVNIPSFGSEIMSKMSPVYTKEIKKCTTNSPHRHKRRSVVLSSSVPRSTLRNTVTKSVRRSVCSVSPSKRVLSTSQPRTSWSSLSVSRGKL
jgi:hypothetical protein